MKNGSIQPKMVVFFGLLFDYTIVSLICIHNVIIDVLLTFQYFFEYKNVIQ